MSRWVRYYDGQVQASNAIKYLLNLLPEGDVDSHPWDLLMGRANLMAIRVRSWIRKARNNLLRRRHVVNRQFALTHTGKRRRL